MKTADLVDAHPDEVRFCNLPFLKFGRRSAFFGPAQTVSCFEDNVLLRAELEKPGEGRVMVVEGGGSTRVAIMGDMLAGLLLKNGWAGAVVNGAIRDSVEIDALDVGLRCLSTTPIKSSKNGTGTVGGPVRFGDATFKPGNWVYCDADGVLVSEEKLSV